MIQAELLKQAFFLLVKSGVCPKTKIKDWVKILLFTHKKGYLYASCENEDVKMIACMYRVKKLTKKIENRFPEEEKGNLLYIPWFASKSENKMLANRLLKSYLKKHPEVDEIAFYERGDESKLKRFKRAKKETKNVKEKKPRTS